MDNDFNGFFDNKNENQEQVFMPSMPEPPIPFPEIPQPQMVMESFGLKEITYPLDNSSSSSINDHNDKE